MTRSINMTLFVAFTGLVWASCSFAQDVAPRARSATNRSIFIHKSSASYLGIGVAEIDAERARALKLKEVRGVEVKTVDPNSPAAKAGLKEGDVVLEFNGQRIEGTEQFVRMVRETPVDRQVRLLVSSNGNPETLTATIGRREPAKFTVHGDGDEDIDVEIPEIPEMPPMAPMPKMPSIPDMPHAWNSARSSMLGIECETLGSQLAQYFGVKEGVLVRSVTKGSAAEKAGMRAGDVIMKIGGEQVTSPLEITRQIHSTTRTKRSVPVVLMRDRKEVTVTVRFESETGLRRGVWRGDYRWC